MSKEKVEIELSADAAKLKSEFDIARARVEKFTKGVRKSVLSLGGLAVGALGVRQASQVFDELTTKFDRLGKIANRFNMPVEEVQRMEVAAGLSGTNVERMVAAMTKATVSGVEAGQGLETYSRAFRSLGINVEAFNAAAPTEKIGMLAQALNSASDEGEAFTAVYRILGKAGGDLIPLLRQNADGIANLTKELKVLGSEDVKAIEKFNDDLLLLKSNMQAEIGKKLSGELKELAPLIVQTGTGIVNVTSFLLKHHRAIGMIVGGVVAYKSAKFGVALAKDVMALGRATVAMLAAKAATDAETAAVVRNTAAHAANAVARSAGAGGGKGAGGKIGKVMGKAAAGSFGVGFLAKFSPHVLAAAIGYGVGKLAGDHLADEMQESYDASWQKMNAPLSETLRQMHDLISQAKTVEETTEARAQITREILRLERESSFLRAGEKKDATEHAILALKMKDRFADQMRIRNQQAAVEEDISAEYEFQRRQQAFATKLALEGMDAAKKRMEALQKSAEAVRKTIAELKGAITADQVDMLPADKRVEIFTEKLKKGLSRAVGEFNFGREGQGKEKAGTDSHSLAGLWELAKQAEREGSEGLAKSIYEQIRELQKIKAEIDRAKGEMNDESKAAADAELEATKERLRKEQEIALEKARQREAKGDLGAEMAILRLEAAGQMKKAEALRTEIRLRKEAKEIAESTGVSESEGLRIARQRESLRRRAEGMKVGASQEDGKGKKRIRLYSAQESLQRRMARQSGGINARGNVYSMDMRSTDLGERFVRDAEASRSGPLTAVVKGGDDVPGRLDELIGLEKRMLKVFENVVKV